MSESTMQPVPQIGQPVTEYTPKKGVGVRVLVGPKGLAYLKEAETRIMLWDDVAELRVNPRRTHWGRLSTLAATFWLMAKDGSKIMLDEKINRVVQLGESIQQHVATHQLATAIKQFNSEQLLTFGKLSLDKQGIHRGKSILPWSDVQAVEPRGWYFDIERKGKKLAWASLPISALINARTFLALCRLALKVTEDSTK